MHLAEIVSFRLSPNILAHIYFVRIYLFIEGREAQSAALWAIEHTSEEMRSGRDKFVTFKLFKLLQKSQGKDAKWC